MSASTGTPTPQTIPPIGTPIMIFVCGLFLLLMDTNQMNQKGRNGYPWSITVTNGGGIVGGESGIRKPSHSLFNSHNLPKNGEKLRNLQNPSSGYGVGFWRSALENASL